VPRKAGDAGQQGQGVSREGNRPRGQKGGTGCPCHVARPCHLCSGTALPPLPWCSLTLNRVFRAFGGSLVLARFSL